MSSTGGGKKKAAAATAAAAAGEPTTASIFAGFGPSDSAAVDDLLRAVEDDLLLNLRVDAHSTGRPSSLISASSSSAFLDPDLSRRFEALRSAPPHPPHPTTSSTAAAARPAAKAAADGDDEWGRILGDDLAARFAALKGTTSPASAADLNPVADGEGREQGSKGPVEEADEEDDEVDEDGVSKKEVEKLMQWAKDAARLDPSTKSDEEDEESDDEDDEEMEMKKKKKVQQPKEQQEKSKPRKWFLF